ncbi:hypothetical protein [Flavobacterium rhizosphaerae]|uniref:Glycosyltransferase family 39 protein n=1 Tax=Flavobacterium rhizosphaerae TaxID=3163298 RepID=A0ABW8Z0M8_9FLAO
MFYKLQALLLKRPILSIVVFNSISRFIIALFYWHVTIFPDSGDYIALTDRLLSASVSGYEGYRTPGYPLLLALAGNILWLAVIYQVICGIVTAIYQYKTIVLLGFNKKTAVYTTLFMNALIHVAFYEFAILTEAFTLLCITLCFYHIFKIFINKTGIAHILFTSLLLGWLVLIKPFYIFIPFLVYALYTLKDFSFRRVINTCLLLTVFPLIAFLGWSYLNKHNTGYFTSTTYFGINLAQMCVYFAEDAHDEYPIISDVYVNYRKQVIQQNEDVAMTIWFAREELQQKTGLTSIPDLSNELAGFSKTAIKNNPGAYLKQVFLSWREFWFSAMYWNYQDFNIPYSNKMFTALWRAQQFVIIILEIAFILLIIPYYLFQFFVKRKISLGAIATFMVFAASVLQAMVTFGTNSRFSYPFEPLLFISLLLFFKEKIRID